MHYRREAGELIHDRLIGHMRQKTFHAVKCSHCFSPVFHVRVPIRSHKCKPGSRNPDFRSRSANPRFSPARSNGSCSDIKTLDPPPDRVVGALTTGEFSWGTFMRTLGAYSEFAGAKTITDHDVPQMIGKMAQIELSRGGKTWAQLYAAMALESFGTDLKHNALWLGLSSEEKEAYLALLDPGRFYDSKNHKLIHLPENYFGVAARIAAIDYELGLNQDRASLDDLLNRATSQFTGGALFADDALPTGRYDRYSNEYARALYDAAALAGATTS